MTSLFKAIANEATLLGYGAKYSSQMWVKDEFKYEFVPLGSARPTHHMEVREWLEITDPGELAASLTMFSHEAKEFRELWDAYKHPEALTKRREEREAAKKAAYSGASHGDGYRGRMTQWGKY